VSNRVWFSKALSVSAGRALVLEVCFHKSVFPDSPPIVCIGWCIIALFCEFIRKVRDGVLAQSQMDAANCLDDLGISLPALSA